MSAGGRQGLCAILGVVLLAGCTKILVRDDARPESAGSVSCSGSEWVDDSSFAVLPIPVVAFFVPHTAIHEIRMSERLQRCGEPSRPANRRVTVSRTACVPAALTRIITLGVWQWCPAYVSWAADDRDELRAIWSGGNLLDATLEDLPEAVPELIEAIDALGTELGGSMSAASSARGGAEPPPASSATCTSGGTSSEPADSRSRPPEPSRPASPPSR